MNNIEKYEGAKLNIFFALWLLSLPFYKFNLIGSLSLDNILAPLLLMIFLFRTLTTTNQHKNKYNPKIIFVIFSLYIFFSLIGLVLSGTNQQVFGSLWILTKFGLYLLLPVFFIKTFKQFNSAIKLVIINMVIVSGTAIADSLGFLTLQMDIGVGASETGRRFGLGLGRSAGIIGANGSFASLLAISSLFLIISYSKSNLLPFNIKPYRIFVLASIIIGILASQSRNIMLTILVAIASYFIIKKLYFSRSNIILNYFIVLITAIFFAIINVIFFPDIYSILLGSGDLEATVNDRFIQYKQSIAFIAQYPILGMPGYEQLKYDSLLTSVHNLWINIALRSGIFSVIIMASLVFLAIIRNYKILKKNTINHHGIAMISLIVAIFFSSNFYAAQNAIFFWVTLGLALSFSCINPSGYYPQSKYNAQSTKT